MPRGEEHEKRRVSYSPDNVAADKTRRGGGARRKSRRVHRGVGAPSLRNSAAGASSIGARRFEVVAFMTKKASDSFNECGYSCGVCRKRGEKLAVGTLNSGDRIVPICIYCFMSESLDADEKHSAFDIDASMHVPHEAVMYVDGLRREWADETAALFTESEENCHRWVEARSAEMAQRFTRLGQEEEGRPGWGCRDALCDGCEEVNCMLRTWAREVKPWYNADSGAVNPVMGVIEPSTPSTRGGSNECPDTDQTRPYEGEMPPTGVVESYSAAMEGTLKSLLPIQDQLRNSMRRMKDIVEDHFWDGQVPNELQARMFEIERASHGLLDAIVRVDETARELMK